MAKVDTDVIADRLAYLEAHCDNEDETRLIDWFAEHMADAIQMNTGTRFSRNQFEILAQPIKHRARAQRIRDHYAKQEA